MGKKKPKTPNDEKQQKRQKKKTPTTPNDEKQQKRQKKKTPTTPNDEKQQKRQKKNPSTTATTSTSKSESIVHVSSLKMYEVTYYVISFIL
jgi:hypothetical protein